MFWRIYNGLVILVWLVAMTWLLREKVIPPLLGGDPPDYQSLLVEARRSPLPDRWNLRWKERPVGYAASHTEFYPDQSVDRFTLVELRRLPLNELLSELLGPLAAMVKPLVDGNTGSELDLLVASRMRFDAQRRLASFDTTIDLGDIRDFLTLTGVVLPDGKLEMVAELSQGVRGPGQRFRHSVQLPPEALVEGALSPRPELKGLYVGQTWTIPVLRSFPPNRPIQMLEAAVEKHEIIMWGAGEVETMEVVYRTDAGSGLHATREPISREWVRKDGEILRHEVRYSGLQITFERESEMSRDPRGEQLMELRERLWPRK